MRTETSVPVMKSDSPAEVRGPEPSLDEPIEHPSDPSRLTCVTGPNAVIPRHPAHADARQTPEGQRDRTVGGLRAGRTGCADPSPSRTASKLQAQAFGPRP